MRDFFDELYRNESRRVLATLIRMLGDFDVAEDALAEAFATAVERWPTDGVPANPRASGGRGASAIYVRGRPPIV